MSDTTFDGAGLENALKTGGLEGKKASTVVIGMVKASEHASHIGFTTAGCESWIDLPITMVDSAKHLGESRCKDHSHPLMEIAVLELGDAGIHVARRVADSGLLGKFLVRDQYKSVIIITAVTHAQSVSGHIECNGD